MGLLLAIIAVILTYLFSPFLMIYTIVRAIAKKGPREGLRYLNAYFKRVAIGVDVLGNVTGGDFWNDVWIKDDSIHPFGGLETMSRGLGVNNRVNNLTGFGKTTGDTLDFIDPNHLEKSI